MSGSGRTENLHPSICFCVVLLLLQRPVSRALYIDRGACCALWRVAGPNLTLQTEKKLHFLSFSKLSLLGVREEVARVPQCCSMTHFCVRVEVLFIHALHYCNTGKGFFSFLHVTLLQTMFLKQYTYIYTTFCLQSAARVSGL